MTNRFTHSIELLTTVRDALTTATAKHSLVFTSEGDAVAVYNQLRSALEKSGNGKGAAVEVTDAVGRLAVDGGNVAGVRLFDFASARAFSIEESVAVALRDAAFEAAKKEVGTP